MDRVKAEYDKDPDHGDLQMAGTRPSYKSWKKKYRKMRYKFDQQMQEIENLHRLEQKAMRTAKRLAIENDRIMDLLMDINDSPQIPFDRRIDLNLDEDSDDNDSDATQKPTKSLRRLESEVPHRSFAASAEQFPELLEDLEPEDPQIHPISFLTADDIDEYLYELDARLKLKPKPTLAPSALGKDIPNPTANFALRNPTSVYNWLRRHAPKTFLQDLEKEKEKDKEKGKGKDDDHEKDDDGRKRKGGTSARTKRQSAATRKEKEKEAAESMDWDDDGGYDMPTAKGKRKRDDDGGYRPKGGSSRPAKKRKSKDLGSLPTKGSRKSNA
ncbi:IEC3 subunit of the Ino80 complex, chromatin re-modelling-domain-containing protein [Annulohypoxylon truncatum]|uniref:IEC3 subunit of the Ino80 complex, chromatin re-modelling-domain-containing protein n=1 Tax=Annulohypoxylon truncatum TaxID=327061 RepID=UPI0020087D5B|nr:IEC3 subunit of the Ino80 complex, chromatin re-modelling-domain-containing protein [Annulohypoxylon truncatum]KAI1207210.1 IEC3 subunit of the Ino80 complex, chromatin re-modelling-domain-containing protein [Annulohypoxylon truncatum]